MKLTIPRTLAIGGVILAVVVHTWFVATGRTSFAYERFTDAFVIAVALALGGYTIKLWREDSGANATLYLILTNVYLLITATHVLRLIFGGLHCGE